MECIATRWDRLIQCQGPQGTVPNLCPIHCSWVEAAPILPRLASKEICPHRRWSPHCSLFQHAEVAHVPLLVFLYQAIPLIKQKFQCSVAQDFATSTEMVSISIYDPSIIPSNLQCEQPHWTHQLIWISSRMADTRFKYKHMLKWPFHQENDDQPLVFWGVSSFSFTIPTN